MGKQKKKKERFNFIKTVKLAYEETQRSSVIIYVILRLLVILCLILQIIKGDFTSAALCLLSIILLAIPVFVQSKFKITLPNRLEIAIYLFVFAAEILGEINNFYGIIPFWDSLLHVINGFLAAAIGFSMVDLLNTNSDKFNLSPFYLCLVAVCFAVTIGVIWEFIEYGADKYFKLDMQKDKIVEQISSVMLNENNENKTVIISGIDKTVLLDEEGNVLYEIEGGYLDIGISDTMKDLLVDFIGAFVFSIFGYFELKNKKPGFIHNFVPQSKKREMPVKVSEELDKIYSKKQE